MILLKYFFGENEVKTKRDKGNAVIVCRHQQPRGIVSLRGWRDQGKRNGPKSTTIENKKTIKCHNDLCGRLCL
jgi:hypothetical protein